MTELVVVVQDEDAIAKLLHMQCPDCEFPVTFAHVVGLESAIDEWTAFDQTVPCTVVDQTQLPDNCDCEFTFQCVVHKEHRYKLWRYKEGQAPDESKGTREINEVD